MQEQETLGTVKADFLSQAEFLRLCEEWLKSNSFHHVVTLNPEMVLLAEKDESFRTAVNKATMRIPDGAGLIWARWYLRSDYWSLWASLVMFMGQQAERITGVDSVVDITRLCTEHNQLVYLLGGTESQVNKAATRLKQLFPTVSLVTAEPHKFSLDGPADVIRDIEQKKPMVLFVAYGAPEQTIWIEKFKAQLPSVKIAMGVGGAFAILSEEKPRAPKWLRRLNLEWVWRLLLEPSRLPRIYHATVKFPLLMKAQKSREQKTATLDA